MSTSVKPLSYRRTQSTSIVPGKGAVMSSGSLPQPPLEPELLEPAQLLLLLPPEDEELPDVKPPPTAILNKMK